MHAPRTRDQADTRLGQGKARVGRGNDDVAGERQLEAAAKRQPLDPRDQRLRIIEAVGEPLYATPARRDLRGVAPAC